MLGKPQHVCFITLRTYIHTHLPHWRTERGPHVQLWLHKTVTPSCTMTHWATPPNLLQTTPGCEETCTAHLCGGGTRARGLKSPLCDLRQVPSSSLSSVGRRGYADSDRTPWDDTLANVPCPWAISYTITCHYSWTGSRSSFPLSNT